MVGLGAGLQTMGARWENAGVGLGNWDRDAGLRGCVGGILVALGNGGGDGKVRAEVMEGEGWGRGGGGGRRVRAKGMVGAMVMEGGGGREVWIGGVRLGEGEEWGRGGGGGKGAIGVVGGCGRFRLEVVGDGAMGRRGGGRGGWGCVSIMGEAVCRPRKSSLTCSLDLTRVAWTSSPATS